MINFRLKPYRNGSISIGADEVIFVLSEIQLKMKKFYLGSTSNGSIDDSLDDSSLVVCQLENDARIHGEHCIELRILNKENYYYFKVQREQHATFRWYGQLNCSTEIGGAPKFRDEQNTSQLTWRLNQFVIEVVNKFGI